MQEEVLLAPRANSCPALAEKLMRLQQVLCPDKRKQVWLSHCGGVISTPLFRASEGFMMPIRRIKSFSDFYGSVVRDVAEIYFARLVVLA
jgi:hypothetical protein